MGLITSEKFAHNNIFIKFGRTSVFRRLPTFQWQGYKGSAEPSLLNVGHAMFTTICFVEVLKPLNSSAELIRS